jgi:urocanate hydratase
LPLEPLSPAVFTFIAQVERAYSGLTPSGHGLGGKLLYAGNLDTRARSLIVAANIAGAATLAASADPAAGKQAMRDGIVDFLVTTLDEALRILKNQIRKRETAAVCVAARAEAIEAEMRERGVQPDIFFSKIGPRSEPDHGTWLTWRATEAPAVWLPKLDAIALGCLPPDAAVARRWLERAPRYLGRLAQNIRTLRTNEPLAQCILTEFAVRTASNEIRVQIEIEEGPWSAADPVASP